MNNINDLIYMLKIKKGQSSNVGEAIKEIVDENSIDILKDNSLFQEKLIEKNISLPVIKQLELMLSIDGIYELSNGEDESFTKYVENALNDSGLTRTIVLDLSCAIANAFGYKVEREYSAYTESIGKNEKIIIPYSIYEKESSDIRKSLEMGDVLTLQQNNSLELLVKQELPEALYCKGLIMESTSIDEALELYKKAADGGYPDALLKCGDIYYEDENGDSWNKAYKYYTGLGSLAISYDRQSRIRNMINQKQYNLRSLFGLPLFIIALIVILLINICFLEYQNSNQILIFAMIIEMVAYIVAICKYIKRPYSSSKAFLPIMFVIWFACMFIWML